MKRRFWVLALALIIIGAALAGIGYAAGANGYVVWDRGFKVMKYTDADDYFEISQTGLTGVESLDISTVYEDIKFVPGDEWGFTIKTYASDPSWNFDNGLLKINLKNKRAILNRLFHIIPFVSSSKDYSSLTVTYPRSGAELNDVKIATTSGNIAFSMSISTKNLSFNTVSGDITTSDIKSEYVSVRTISGNMKISSLLAGTFKFDSTSGDVDVDAIQVQNLHLETTSGNSRFFGDIESGSLNSISGDMYIDGKYGGGMIDTTSGNVFIFTDYGADEFSGSIRTISGDIDVDGKKGSKNWNFSGSGRNMNISTTSGNINIDFK